MADAGIQMQLTSYDHVDPYCACGCPRDHHGVYDTPGECFCRLYEGGPLCPCTGYMAMDVLVASLEASA